MDDSHFMANLESCIRNGLPILIENVEEWIDPVMDPILSKDIYKKGFTYFIKMGENEI
jgi:dynein heavy chain, axonemal